MKFEFLNHLIFKDDKIFMYVSSNLAPQKIMSNRAINNVTRLIIIHLGIKKKIHNGA